MPLMPYHSPHLSRLTHAGLVEPPTGNPEQQADSRIGDGPLERTAKTNANRSARRREWVVTLVSTAAQAGDTRLRRRASDPKSRQASHGYIKLPAQYQESMWKNVK
ncbi:MAG: hypothetical protein ACODAD_14705 [Planctomycetota bacterium]